MTPDDANKLRSKYAAAEKATDSLLERLAESPWSFAAIAFITFAIVVAIFW